MIRGARIIVPEETARQVTRYRRWVGHVVVYLVGAQQEHGLGGVTPRTRREYSLESGEGNAGRHRAGRKTHHGSVDRPPPGNRLREHVVRGRGVHAGYFEIHGGGRVAR